MQALNENIKGGESRGTNGLHELAVRGEALVNGMLG